MLSCKVCFVSTSVSNVTALKIHSGQIMTYDNIKYIPSDIPLHLSPTYLIRSRYLVFVVSV